MFRQTSFINTYPHCCSSIAKLCETLQCHGLQHSRLPRPSLSPRICWNSCPLSQWCHPIISPSAAPFFCLQLFLASGSFPVSQLFTSGDQSYSSFSFSISPSNEYSGVISFRMDWFDLLAVQGTLKSLLQHHSLKASILWCSAFFMVQLSHLFMTTGKTIALTMKVKVTSLSCVRLFATPWMVAYQVPRSLEFSRQEYWSG